MKTGGRIAILILLIAAAAAYYFLSGRAPIEEETPPPLYDNMPNVVLITLDTTRADYFGVFGAPPTQTPQMDLLAADGAAFSNAVSAAFGTTPSHTSIMTSKHSRSHGVYNNLMYMSKDETTLAEILRANGYTTAAAIGSFPVNSERNFHQGFDFFDQKFDINMDGNERRAEAVTKSALRFLNNNKGRPFFLWAHYFDPHLEYDPPEPFRSLFFPDVVIQDNYRKDILELGIMKKDITIGFTLEDNAHLEIMKGFYSGEIAYTDSEVGNLLYWFSQYGEYDNTIFIIVGDHGESLDEYRHLEYFHHHDVFQEVMRVPLIMKFPGLKNGIKTAAPVSTIDILPTILDYLRIPTPDGVALEGISVLDISGGNPPADADKRPIFFETGSRIGAGVILGDWKYLRLFKPNQYFPLEDDRCEEAVFDLAGDPGELVNVAMKNPDHPKIAELRSVFDEWWTTPDQTESNERELTGEKEKERLRQLGYIH